jgi:hypothetical protein
MIGAAMPDDSQIEPKRGTQLNAQISLIFDLSGQKGYEEEYDNLISIQENISLRDFFKILKDIDAKYDRLEQENEQSGYNPQTVAKGKKLRRNRREERLGKLADLFKKHDLSFPEDISNPLKFISKKSDSSPTPLLIAYLFCYAYKEFVLSESEDIDDIRKMEGQIQDILLNLEKTGFTPAYHLHSKLENLPANASSENSQKKCITEGALLGDLSCQYSYIDKYLVFLKTRPSKRDNEEFVFENNIDEEIVKSWISELQQMGHIGAQASISNFISDVIGALPAIHDPNVEQWKKEALIHAAELAKSISNDENINSYIDEMFNLGSKGYSPEKMKEKIKIIRPNADKYIQSEYMDAFKVRRQAAMPPTMRARILDEVSAIGYGLIAGPFLGGTRLPITKETGGRSWLSPVGFFSNVDNRMPSFFPRPFSLLIAAASTLVLTPAFVALIPVNMVLGYNAKKTSRFSEGAINSSNTSEKEKGEELSGSISESRYSTPDDSKLKEVAQPIKNDLRPVSPLSGISKRPVATQYSSEEATLRNLIVQSESLDEIIDVLENYKGVLRSHNGSPVSERRKQLMIEEINNIKNGASYLESHITRAYGLRDKVESLAQSQRSRLRF